MRAGRVRFPVREGRFGATMMQRTVRKCRLEGFGTIAHMNRVQGYGEQWHDIL